MKGQIWAGWVLFVILAVFSIILLMGKGSFLIAGYNSLEKKEKEQYNEKRLCRVVGGGFGIIAVMMGISLFYKFEYPVPILNLMIPWGVLAVIVLILVLTNTICRKK